MARSCWQAAAAEAKRKEEEKKKREEEEAKRKEEAARAAEAKAAAEAAAQKVKPSVAVSTCLALPPFRRHVCPGVGLWEVLAQGAGWG